MCRYILLISKFYNNYVCERLISHISYTLKEVSSRLILFDITLEIFNPNFSFEQ